MKKTYFYCDVHASSVYSKGNLPTNIVLHSTFPPCKYIGQSELMDIFRHQPTPSTTLDIHMTKHDKIQFSRFFWGESAV